MAVGNMVVDRGSGDATTRRGAAKWMSLIYEVEQGQIAKARVQDRFPVYLMRARSSRALLQRHHRLCLLRTPVRTTR